MRELLYHLPLVGVVPARLFNESSELLSALESSGEVSRLRLLDHLGPVRLAIEGAHHPRWEYVVTTLALIHRAASTDGIQLKSKTNVGPIAFSSARELLNCWSLLLNVGHLTWTFAAERILLQEVWGHRESRDALLNAVPPGLRTWSYSVLQAGNAYSLYQLLGFVRIDTVLANMDARMRTKFAGALEAYVRPDTSVQLRLRSLFRRLRRVAYLGLDTTYSPSHVRLSLSQLLSDTTSFRRLALSESDSDETELSGLDAYMARHVYLAEDVLRVSAEREPDLRARVRASLREAGLRPTVESLAFGDERRPEIRAPGPDPDHPRW